LISPDSPADGGERMAAGAAIEIEPRAKADAGFTRHFA
jgi:hypothetical protein